LYRHIIYRTEIGEGLYPDLEISRFIAK